MSDLKPPINPYQHAKNIRVGAGRILWGVGCRPVLKFDDNGEALRGAVRAGWVLPGGMRTQSSSEALAAAAWIDQNHRGGLAQRL